jgi:hypothetical protein
LDIKKENKMAEEQAQPKPLSRSEREAAIQGIWLWI